MNQPPAVLHAANALTSWVGSVSTEVANLSKSVAMRLERNLAGKSTVDKRALAGLDELAQDFLGSNAFAVGAGAFFATAIVEDRSWE